MAELRDLADAKIKAERTKLIGGLRPSIESIKRRNAANGMLRSGNTLLEITNVCGEALIALKAVVLEQYTWAVSESLAATQSFVFELVAASRDQFAPLLESCADHIRAESQLIGAANAANECIDRLQRRVPELTIDIDLALRSQFASKKRGRVRGLGKLLWSGVSKFLGVPKA